MRIPSLRAGFAIVLALLLSGGTLPTNAPPASLPWTFQGQSRALALASPATKPGHPRLQSVLNELMLTHHAAGAADAEALANRHGISLNGGEVSVVVETEPGGVDQVAAALEPMGAREETRHGDLFQIRVPVGALADVADLPWVGFVRMPFLARVIGDSRGVERSSGDAADKQSGAVVSEGVITIGADAWHRAGVSGQGAKVAIIDIGFLGYQSELGTELPSSVDTRSFRTDGDLTGSGERHGTAVAEIIHDVAPDASLLLINFRTDVEWANAVDYAVSQGAHIVSSSVGFAFGPYDGTGPFSSKVTETKQAGVFWAQSAGNEATEHWAGVFDDPDGNGRLNFGPGVEQNAFSVQPGGDIQVILSWDDWPLSNQDYELVLLHQADGRWVEVDRSDTRQSGTQPPFESIFGTTATGGTFAVAIDRFSATRNVRFQLYTLGNDLQLQVAATSLTIPADAPGAVAAAATRFDDDRLEPFSSRGPTVDGRAKPDLAAPDGVSTVTYGPRRFFGTSSSAPHLAGAAALVKSANPSLGPSAMQAFLEGRAVDLGPPGKDNLFGAGRLSMGSPDAGRPAPPPAPSVADARIQIVFPHDAAGNPTEVVDGGLVNVSTFLFASNSLNPVPCSLGRAVTLFRSLNNGVAEQVNAGVPRLITTEGKRIVAWEHDDVDVGQATDPVNKYYFFVVVDGVPSRTNIWSHGAVARTSFPEQDVPTGVGPLGSAVDAKIEAVLPHDAAGNPRPALEADLANVAVDIFSPGTLESVPTDANLTVRLLRSLNDGVQEPVGVGRKQTVTHGGIAHPQWIFDGVDVSAGRNPLNRYYFRVVVDGIASRSNVWSHGADARTAFPKQDVPATSCQ